MVASKEPTIYGTWQLNVRDLVADQVLGAQLRYALDGKPKGVAVQFDSPMGRHSVEFEFLNAMFLLSLLKSIQLDTGTPFPDDPRGDFRRKPVN